MKLRQLTESTDMIIVDILPSLDSNLAKLT